MVIPAPFRKALNINEDTYLQFFLQAQGLFIRLLKTVPVIKDDNSKYLALLESIRGSWGPETDEDRKIEKKIRKIELAAVKKSRNAW